jgi:hypothetical protein
MNPLREAAQFALDALHCPGDSELMERVEAKLRAALAEQPAQEPVAKVVQGTMKSSHAPQPRKRLDVHEILDLMPEGVPARYDGELIEFARAIEAAVWGDGK